MPSGSDRPRPDTGRRGEVLRTLKKAAQPLSITDIAERLGVHPNTVRFHVDTLATNGQIERVNAEPRRPGRPPQLFRAVAGMDPTGPRHYRLLAEVLADTLRATPDRTQRAIEAGRLWGYQHASAQDAEAGPDDPVDRLVTLLDDVDFAPERSDGNERGEDGSAHLSLRHCPFLEIAVDHPEVACPIHLGLMQGALAAWRSPVTVDRLDAFVDPDRCVAHLAAAEHP